MVGFSLDWGSDQIKPRQANGANRDAAIDLGASASRWKDLYLSGTAIAQELKSTANQTFTHQTGSVVTFRNSSNQERMRIDSSGNLLVGKTSAGIANNGIELRANDDVLITKDGATALYLNRKSSDGEIIEFRKDGSTVGSIGASSGVLFIDGPSGNGISLPNNGVFPATSGGARDNLTDLGASYARFDDIYATNGTIQTYLTATKSKTLQSYRNSRATCCRSR